MLYWFWKLNEVGTLWLVLSGVIYLKSSKGILYYFPFILSSLDSSPFLFVVPGGWWSGVKRKWLESTPFCSVSSQIPTHLKQSTCSGWVWLSQADFSCKYFFNGKYKQSFSNFIHFLHTAQTSNIFILLSKGWLKRWLEQLSLPCSNVY